MKKEMKGEVNIYEKIVLKKPANRETALLCTLSFASEIFSNSLSTISLFSHLWLFSFLQTTNKASRKEPASLEKVLFTISAVAISILEGLPLIKALSVGALNFAGLVAFHRFNVWSVDFDDALNPLRQLIRQVEEARVAARENA